MVSLVECPRDAMQGIKTLIPTPEKIAYLQQLLSCDFDYLDFGSFVSPKAVPQMADTNEVLNGLDLSVSKTRLLAIVANYRGAEQALDAQYMDVLGFPVSLSELVQWRNTQPSREEAFAVLERIHNACQRRSKESVVYVSMGFGNPYGEVWNLEVLVYWVERLAAIGIRTLSLSDTTASANPEGIHEVFSMVSRLGDSGLIFGAHLHARPDQWKAHVEAAYLAGCRRFDSAIQGFGGCPMATDGLVGNIPTEKLVSFLTAQKEEFNLNHAAFEVAYNHAKRLFSTYL
jgi:hydroxymethylglutaryl-CoA lyase